LVEGTSLVEHITHILYLAHIPVREIPIEGSGFPEHNLHILYAAHIPRGDIRIKGRLTPENTAHIRNATGTGGGRVCLGYLPCGAFSVDNPIYGSCIAHACVRTDYSNPVGKELKVLCVKCELAA